MATALELYFFSRLTPPAGRLAATGQLGTLANGASVQCTGWTTDFVQGGMASGATSFVVPWTGKYVVGTTLLYNNSGASPGTGAYLAHIFQNSTMVHSWSVINTTGSGAYPSPGGATILTLNANDAVSLYAEQYGGATYGFGGINANYPADLWIYFLEY